MRYSDLLRPPGDASDLWNALARCVMAVGHWPSLDLTEGNLLTILTDHACHSTDLLGRLSRARTYLCKGLMEREKIMNKVFKKKGALLLSLPLLFVVACSDDEAPVPPAPSFTSGYDLGTLVVLEGTEYTKTTTFVELNGEVTQVDGLDAEATANNHCKVDDDAFQTVEEQLDTIHANFRVAGQQKAWILPDTYGTTSGENAIHVWGDPSSGQMYFSKPNLDVLLNTQSMSDRELRSYMTPLEVNLSIFEAYGHFSSHITTTETWNDGGEIVNVTNEIEHGQNSMAGQFARYVVDGYVWETNLGPNFYSGAGFNAEMILPDSVRVGDTWINFDGDLVGAVGIDTIDVGGQSIRALHVVTRGTGGFAMQDEGVSGWCVDYYQSIDDEYDGGLDEARVGRSAALTELCDNGTIGWINESHTWYYRGLPVKSKEEFTTINLVSYGYSSGATDDPTDHPAGSTGGTPGDEVSCITWDLANGGVNPTGTEAQMNRLRPYAIYSVTTNVFEGQATEVRTDYTLVTETSEAGVEL